MFTKDAVIIYLFTYKGYCPYFPFCLQRTAVLVFCYSFAKDHSPCVVVFILKGPLSLSSLFICKGPPSSSYVIHLQRTAVLVLCYSFAKDRRSCLMLFICKGLPYLFCAISLQRKTVVPAIHSLSWQDKMDCNTSKAWGNCFPFRVCENGCYTN